MIRSISPSAWIQATVASALLTLVSAFVIHTPILGALALVLLTITSGQLIGNRLFPNTPPVLQTILGAFAIFGAWSLLGSAVYYLMPVSTLPLFIVVTITTILAIGFAHDHISVPTITFHRTRALSYLFILIALSGWWMVLSSFSILEPVRTLWGVIDAQILFAILLACTFLFGLAATRITMPLLIATTLVLGSVVFVTAYLYPLGFGFDPFIHRTTVAHIAEYGTITPKPLYYVGQYALELIAAKIFSLPISITDRLLVPLLAALFLPASAAFATLHAKQKNAGLLLAIFLLPISAFIVTTPQGLSYLYAAGVFFLSVPRLFGETKPSYGTLVLFTTAALITHPLAGIPAAIYLVLLWTATHPGPHPRMNHFVTGIAALLGAFSLPIVFMVQAQQSGLPIRFQPTHLFNISRLHFEGFFDNRFHPLLDAAYGIIANQLWILLALGIIASIYFSKKHLPFSTHVPLIAAITFLANYWILSTVLEFDFLIEYERQNYSVRMLTLAMFALAVPVGILISAIFERMKTRPILLQISVVTLLALVATANVYGAFPRHDNYARSSGFNVGENDINAVIAIHEDAGETPYIVLANQAVSAAALETYGFYQYFHGDIFYYPIPTGGELYQRYLEGLEHPNRRTMEDAMDLAGVNHAYFVVNDYWWQSESIIENAKTSADSWFAVGNGAITVFEYQR